MRIAIYSRVSTKDKGQDVENQLIQLREFATRSGWTVMQEYSDHITGKTDKRPGMDQMFASASRREFDLLLFWSMDRLSREGALATLQHLERLAACKVGFRSYTEAFIDSCGPFGPAIISFIACVAKQEAVKISDRTKAGLARIKAKGIVLGRPNLQTDLRVQALDLRSQGITDLGEIAKRVTYTTKDGEIRNPSTATVRRALAEAA
jgi:DNA invertase Pin-like site-specific DNA recombinase